MSAAEFVERLRAGEEAVIESFARVLPYPDVFASMQKPQHSHVYQCHSPIPESIMPSRSTALTIALVLSPVFALQAQNPSANQAQLQAEDQAQTQMYNQMLAQNGPLASPRDTTRDTIGAAHVLVDYGRPSKRGRVIFSDLVPYGEVWRTGANAATTLVTDKDLTIGKLAVPAGTYTLYTIPAAASWQLIINKEIGQWGLTYHQELDLGRVPMAVSSTKMPVEKFLIDFTPGMMRFQWDTTVVQVPIAEKK
jgi:hypothetical protein